MLIRYYARHIFINIRLAVIINRMSSDCKPPVVMFSRIAWGYRIIYMLLSLQQQEFPETNEYTISFVSTVFAFEVVVCF